MINRYNQEKAVLFLERVGCHMEQGIKASKKIGQNIGKFRMQKRLTQDALAAKMQSLGCDISRGTLAKIESGIRHISVAEIEAIRTILDMQYADFFME